MYYSAARQYIPWILEGLKSQGKINEDIGYRLAKELENNRDIFNDLVYRMCQKQGRPADPHILKEATYNALGQLYSKLRSSDNFSRDSWGGESPSFDSFYRPKEDYNVWTKRPEPYKNIVDKTYNMFNQSSSEYERRSENTRGNNLFDSSEPFEKRVEEVNSYIEPPPEKEILPSKDHIKLSITSMENYTTMTTEEKLHIRIAGATKQQIDNKIFELDRQVIKIVRDGQADLNIKYDQINLYKSGIIFDSCRDVIDSLSGQMSRDDIDKFYFRVIGFNMLKQLDISHEIFFREKERLDQILSEKDFVTTSDVYTNLDILLSCYEFFKNMHPEYVVVLEKFMVEELNDFLFHNIRLSAEPEREIKVDSIKDLEEFLRDSRFSAFRAMPTFEPTMNTIIINLINYLHGNGESLFLNFDSLFQSAYTKTRKYMTMSSKANGINSLDFYQYVDEVKQIMITEMKKKVLVSIPSSMIVTNFYSPGFVRKTLTNINKPVQLIAPDIKGNSYEDFMYFMIAKQVDDKTRVIPASFIYVSKNEDLKMLQLGVTLDDHVIIS